MIEVSRGSPWIARFIQTKTCKDQTYTSNWYMRCDEQRNRDRHWSILTRMREIHTRAPNSRSLWGIRTSGGAWLLYNCLTHITEVRTIETWVHRILEFGCVNNISARGLDVATAYSNCVERKLSLNCSVLRGFLTQNNPTTGLPENGEWKPRFLLNFSRIPSTPETESRDIAKARIWSTAHWMLSWKRLIYCSFWR